MVNCPVLEDGVVEYDRGYEEEVNNNREHSKLVRPESVGRSVNLKVVGIIVAFSLLLYYCLQSAVRADYLQFFFEFQCLSRFSSFGLAMS